MEVLLAAVDGGGDPEHKHYARLVYDTAYEVSGATQLARRLACEKLERVALVLPVAPGGPKLVLPDEIIDVDAAAGRPLPLGLLDPDPGADLACRFTLPAGAVTAYELGNHFEFGAAPSRRMTWEVEWTIRGIPSDRLEWSLLPFGAGSSPVALQTLYPIGDTIRVRVYNVTCRFLPMDMGPIDAEPEVAHHFAGYYSLYRTGVNQIPVHSVTQYLEKGGCPCESEPDTAEDRAHGEHAADHGEHAGHPEQREPAGREGEEGHVRHLQAVIVGLSEGGGFGGSPVTCVVGKGSFGG